MRMSLQYQYMLDMEKEKGQMALFKYNDFWGGGGGGGITPIILLKVTIKSG